LDGGAIDPLDLAFLVTDPDLFAYFVGLVVVYLAYLVAAVQSDLLGLELFILLVLQ
jgi:hypothetical protein